VQTLTIHAANFQSVTGRGAIVVPLVALGFDEGSEADGRVTTVLVHYAQFSRAIETNNFALVD
jgi:hypothetical protein